MANTRASHEIQKFPCGQCNYKAKAKKTLQTHIWSQHKGVKYSCDQCDYQFTQQNNLITHMKKKHSIKNKIN